jgi:hypothetical protein
LRVQALPTLLVGPGKRGTNRRPTERSY